MNQTIYNIARMDCLSEENLIRMKLEGLLNIKSLRFEIPQRKLYVVHEGNEMPVTAAIDSLHLNSSLIKTQEIDDEQVLLFSDDTGHEKKLLQQVLAINFFFFLVEITSGFISGSMGLVADSLDMLADSVVYGLALFVVGEALLENIAKKHKSVIVKDKAHVSEIFPWVHIAISNVKKKILNLHHGVKETYMQNYLNEFCYKFSRRNQGKDLFHSFLKVATSYSSYPPCT